MLDWLFGKKRNKNPDPTGDSASDDGYVPASEAGYDDENTIADADDRNSPSDSGDSGSSGDAGDSGSSSDSSGSD